MTERIDVIGAGGLVGSVVKKDLPSLIESTPNSKELNILSPEQVSRFVSNSLSRHILLLAANTDVERIQKEGAGFANVNQLGVENVAKACKEYGKHLIFISSDFVFPGTEDRKGPYLDTDLPEPEDSKLIGEYARTKLMGENIVKGSGCKYSIIRIAYPFGNPESEKDFAKKTLNIVQNGYALFDDQVFSPTYIPDLSKAIGKIVKEDLSGTFHVACTPVTTPFEFGTYLVGKLRLSLEVKAGSLKEFIVGRTPKPLFGGLIPSKEFEVSDWKNAVEEFVLKVK